MEEVEKIRDVRVSARRVYSKTDDGVKIPVDTMTLVVPKLLAKALNIARTRRATLYVSPPIGKVTNKENFTLMYCFGETDVKGEWEQVNVDDYVEKEDNLNNLDIGNLVKNGNE